MDVAAHAAAHAAAHCPAQQALYESQLSNVQRIVKNIFLSDEDLASGPVEDVIRFLQKDCWKTAGSLFFAVAESLRERFVSIDKSLAGLLKSSAGIKTRVDEHSGTILGNTNEIKHLRKLKADKTRVDEVVQAHKSLFDKVNGFFLYTKEDAEALKTAQQGVNQLRGTVDGFQNTKANDTDLQATLATVKDLDGTVKQLNGTVSGLEDLKVDVKDLKAAQQTLGELHDKLGDLDTIKAKASGFQETVETVTGLTGRINVLESANTEFMPWKEEMDNVTSKTSGEISSMKDSKAESKDLEKTDMELNLLSGKVDKLGGSKADDANALKATQKTVEQLTTKVHNLDNTKIDESAITTSKEFLLRELSTHKINTSREIVEMGLDIQGLRNTKADRNILDTTRDTLNRLSSKVNGLDSRPADVTDLTDVTSRLDGLDTSLQAMGARHDDLSDRINGLATPVDGLDTASIQVMGEQQGHLTNRVLSLETDRNKSSKRLADTEKAKDTLKADLAVARKDIVSVSKSASNNDAAIGKLRDQKASVKLLDAANARIDDLQKELDAKNSEHQKDKAAMQAQMNVLIKRFESMPQWVGATEPARVQPEDLQSIREQVSSEATQQIDELRSKTASQHEEVVKAHDEHKKYVLAEFETCAYHDDVQKHIKNCSAQGIQTQVDAIQQKLASLNSQHVSDTSFRDTIRGTIDEALRSEIFEAVVNTVVQNNSQRDYSHEDIVAAVEEEFNSMKFRDQILAKVIDNCTSVLQKHRKLNASSPHNSSLRLINGGQPTHGEYGHHQNVDTIPMGSDHENRTVEDKLGSGDGSPGDHPGLISGGPATSPTDEPPRVYTGEQAPYTDDDDDDGASSSRNLKGKGPCPPDGLTYAQRNGSATPESAVDGDQEWQSGEDEETDDEDHEDDEDDPDHGQDSDDDDDDEDGNDHDQSQGGANGHNQSGTGDHDHQGDGSQHHHGGQDPTHGGHDEAAADGAPGPNSGTHTTGHGGKSKSDPQRDRTRQYVSRQRGREKAEATRAREERRAARIAARWEARQQVQRERKAAAAAAAAAANAAPGGPQSRDPRQQSRNSKYKARTDNKTRQEEAEKQSPALAKLNREHDELKARKIAENAEQQSRRDRAKPSFRGSSSGSSRGSRGSGRGRGNGRGGWGSGRGHFSNAGGTSGNANGTGNNTNGTGADGGWSSHDGSSPRYSFDDW
ncbi:hypothetical protein Daus18300_000542 [Diaporthe australafricana]|uniref:Uncharacterized protein n=1 Tax=Diaporthe australafricana TaxID=127596 RepID=A0ABR3Y5A2_9PEZI